MIAEVSQYVAVASFAEAWIEIFGDIGKAVSVILSPPSRRRGLKFWADTLPNLWLQVASFAEAWIEIFRGCSLFELSGRLLRGGVD